MINSKYKKILIEWVENKCEECGKKFLSSELEIHRIRPGNQGGTYHFRNLKVLCFKCHNLFSSADRIAMGIQSPTTK